MPSNPDLTIDALLSHAGSLRALARGLLGGDEHAAEDVVQETWIAALQKSPGRDVPLGGWLRGVARHLALKRRREEGRRSDREWSVAQADSAAGDDSDLAQSEVLRRLVDAVLGLDEMYRQVVLMRYFQDLPPREIARRLDAPVATVDHRLHRAKKTLRERLDAEAGGERRQWVSALAAATGWQLSKNSGGLAMGWSLAVSATAVVTAAVVATFWTLDSDAESVRLAALSQPGQSAPAPGVSAVKAQDDEPGPQRHPVVSAAPVDEVAMTEPDLPYTYRLEGRVVDTWDQGVAYPEVWVVPLSHPLDGPISADAQGRFSVTWKAAAPEMEVLVWVDQEFVGFEPAAAQRLKLGSGNSKLRTVLVRKKDPFSKKQVAALTDWVGSQDSSGRGPAAGDFERVFRWPLLMDSSAGEVIESVVEVVTPPASGYFYKDEKSAEQKRANRREIPIEGTVYAADGSPAVRAILVLQDEQGEDLRRVATTDKEGHYAFEVTPGRYRLKAGGGTYGLASTELLLEPAQEGIASEVAALQSQSWSPILDRGQEIHGRLLLEGGELADNWLVTLLSEDERSLILDATLTDDGQFTLPNVAAGGRLLLSPPGLEFAAQVVETGPPSQEPLEIVIESSKLALGTLRLSLSASGEGWHPEPWVLQLNSGRMSWLRPNGETGAHERELPAGRYRVVAGTARHGFLDLGQVQVAPGEVVELTATLPEPGSLTWRTDPTLAEARGPAAEWAIYRLQNGIASLVGSGLVTEPPSAPLPTGEYALYLDGRELRFHLPSGTRKTLELQED